MKAQTGARISTSDKLHMELCVEKVTRSLSRLSHRRKRKLSTRSKKKNSINRKLLFI